MYSILTAASTMSMWGFVKLLPDLTGFQKTVRSNRWRWWLLYLIGTEWALLTHYHAILIIGAQGLFLLLVWRRYWRGYLYWGGALIVILLLYLPWLLFGASRVKDFLHWLPQPTLSDAYLRSLIAFTVGEYMPRPEAIPLALIFLFGYGLGLLYATRRSWERLAFLLAYTLAPIFAAWLYGELRTPVFLERYLIPVQVGFLLAVSLGILAIYDFALRAFGRFTIYAPRFRYIPPTLCLLTLISLNSYALWQHYYNPAYAKDDWRAVIRTIENFSLPGDAIVLTGDGGERLFDYYYHGQLPIYLDFLTPVPPENKAREIMAHIAATHRRVWYTPYGVDIDATLENWLAQQAYPAWHSWLGRKRLALYAGSGASTARLEKVNTVFADSQGHGLTLLSVALATESTAAGDLLPLTLTWRTATQLERDYQLSLRLINERGDTFTQSDWPPLAAVGGTSTWLPNQPITDRRSLWLPADLPPGQYALQVVVYNPNSGQALGQPLIIPHITISPAQLTPPLTTLSIPNFIHHSPFAIPHSPFQITGYALPDQIQPGQEMWLWLYWLANPDVTSFDDGAHLQINLNDGQNQAGADILFTDSTGPLDSWQPGQVRRAVYHVRTSPRLAGNQVQVKVSLLDSSGQVISETQLGNIRLAVRPRQFAVPAISRPVNTAFDSPAKLRLLGYDTPAMPANNQLPITLYWQAEAEMDTAYTVFVQLLNSAGQVVAQVDQPPLTGAAPTTTWLPGEVLTDSYTLTIPAETPPGAYRLIVGMYNPATGQRLTVSGGGNFVELSQVTVQ